MDKIKVFALGGLDENGRDCYVVEINDDIFVLDAGVSLPDKNIPGVDYLLPNASYLIENKSRIVAYIMTHGHDENMSALKYFYKSAPAPIYCTEATKYIIEGQAKLQGVKTKMDFITIQPSGQTVIANHIVKFFQTMHNAPYSCGVAIETNRGNIVYTGDFIVDYDVSDPAFIFDLQALSRISEQPTLLLLTESKKATSPGYCSPRHKIVPHIEKYFKDGNSRIFINCFWQNISRIKEICNLTKKYRKKLFFYDDYTRKIMTSMHAAFPDLYDASLVINSEDFLRVKAKDMVILMIGKEEELYDEVNALAFHTNKDKRITLCDSDIFISAAVATPTLEVAATHAIDNLYRTGCEVVWIKSKDITPLHACQDDIKLFLTLLKPQYYLPVRGNFTNLMANAKLAIENGVNLNHMNVFILDNGMQLVFDGDRPKIIPNEVNKIKIDPVLVDGSGIGITADEVIEDRKKLGVDGVVVVAASVSIKEQKILAGPDCQMRGFVYVKEAEPLLKSISNIFVDEINTAFQAGRFNLDEIYQNVADRSQKFIKRENGREPYIIPIISVEE